LVTWTVAQRQITAAARGAWLREFREKTAAFLYAYDTFFIYATTGKHTTDDPEKEAKLASINDAQRLPYQAIRLLIAEKAGKAKYLEFVASMERLLHATVNDVSARRDELFRAIKQILESERASIEKSRSIWSDLSVTLGLRRP
jgi:hypothetical protein